MALKSETSTLATIQMRRGMEEDFEPDQMTAGEWAVSTDTKYVRMCFMPGLCLRMATYEAFEKDMEEIRRILVEARDIQLAIETWYKLAESYAHGGTGTREGEDTDNAKYYSDQAKISADNASAIAGVGIMTTEKAGIGKPDGTTITADEDGTLRVIGGGGASGDFASKAIYGDNAVSLGRLEGSEVGNRSIAYGDNLIATGFESVNFGQENQTTDMRSVAFGFNNESSGANSLVSGTSNKAIGFSSASFGNNCVSVDNFSYSEGCGNVALGYGSHAENCQNVAGAKYIFKIESYDSTAKKFTFDNTYNGFSDAFAALEVDSKLFVQNTNYIDDASIYTVSAKGSDWKSIIVNEDIPTSNYLVTFATIVKSDGNYSGCHAEGRKNVALNIYSHAEGYMTEARGECSHSEGYMTKATGNHSYAGGSNTLASGLQSFAEGNTTIASGNRSHAMGYKTEALYDQLAIGHYNNTELATGGNYSGAGTGSAFVIGNGAYSGKSNAVRIDYNGKLWCKQAYSSTGADYAELFEWADGNVENEDRRGYFVTIDGKKIKKASSGDYIVGIISGNPSVIGNTDMEWYGQFMRDEFGTFIKETHKETVNETSIDEDGNVTEEEREVDVEFYKVNPDYDPDAPYTFRLDRPEWDAVGMLGVLPVRDDGTCEVGKFCKCADGGTATLATERGVDTYMVIERVSENIVSVILK